MVFMILDDIQAMEGIRENQPNAMGDPIQKDDLAHILGEQDIVPEANKQFTFSSATKVLFISGNSFSGNFN